MQFFLFVLKNSTIHSVNKKNVSRYAFKHQKHIHLRKENTHINTNKCKYKDIFDCVKSWKNIIEFIVELNGNDIFSQYISFLVYYISSFFIVFIQIYTLICIFNDYHSLSQLFLNISKKKGIKWNRKKVGNKTKKKWVEILNWVV